MVVDVEIGVEADEETEEVGFTAVPAAELAEVVAAEEAFLYILSLLGPPQYSVVLPLQVMSHCVIAGVLPATSALPCERVSPQ